jgi:hypothetical protein
MSYNRIEAGHKAFCAISELARVLQDAVNHGQEFTYDIHAGKAGPAHLDGSCEIRVSIKPPAHPIERAP